MVKLDKIYTRGGDQGSTSLGDGTRISKSSARINAIGCVDESNAALGVAALYVTDSALSILQEIQNDLFDLGADLCIPTDSRKSDQKLKITPHHVLRLESWIDTYTDQLTPLTSFVLPGGSKASAYLHLARTVARHAERSVILLGEHAPLNPEVVKYLNRLSDLLFVMGRHQNNQGKDDILWKPGAHS